ncbi:MAG: hypothetical protein IMZ53_00940 [Thermoplasmata archaeon]|nr:hypothetical protein [Thermoplasmata archaeon]MBE3139130.1 hypothetical protein [Thermoplasmata archaeon]
MNDKNYKSSGFLANSRRLLSCYIFTLFEILAAQMNLFDTLLTKWRKPVFSREIQMLNITPMEKVLHLGCGALPSATIFIAKDKNAHGDGVNYPVHTFDVIYIAINVWPIDSVLLHLAQTMKPTARILCKGSHDDIAALLKKKEFQSLFSINSTSEHPKTRSFLLTKKKVNG